MARNRLPRSTGAKGSPRALLQLVEGVPRSWQEAACGRHGARCHHRQVQQLRREGPVILKEVVAEQAMKLRLLKKA